MHIYLTCILHFYGLINVWNSHSFASIHSSKGMIIKFYSKINHVVCFPLMLPSKRLKWIEGLALFFACNLGNFERHRNWNARTCKYIIRGLVHYYLAKVLIFKVLMLFDLKLMFNLQDISEIRIHSILQLNFKNVRLSLWWTMRISTLTCNILHCL